MAAPSRSLEMEKKEPEIELFIRNNLHAVDPQKVHSPARQHMAALIANLASLSAGIALGWSSPALPILQRESDATVALYIDTEQGSWVSAIVALGAAIGALPAGVLADKFGRKKVLLALSSLTVLGWILILVAGDKLWMVLAGRLLTGLALGASTVIVPLYGEEIAEVPIRGALGAYVDFMMCVGVLWIYVLGAILPYYWYTASGCILPLVYLLTFMRMPESPLYLAAQGSMQSAKESLVWLRGGEEDYDVQPELDAIVASFKDVSDVKMRRSMLIFCSKSPFRSTTARAVAIVLGLMLFQQLSGINAVIFYTVQIFNEAGSNLSGEMSTIIVGIVQVIAVFSSSIAVDRLGRRFLLLQSCVGMSLCLCMLSLYAFFTKDSPDEIPQSVLWIPLFSLILYVVVFALGFGPLAFCLMAELLPNHAKGWASALSVSFNWTIALVLTKEFPLMLSHLGQDITYGLLCIFCICGGIFVFFCVPETMHKTRAEIQESLGGDRP